MINVIEDPSKAPEMKPLLEKMRKGNIPWAFGSKALFLIIIGM